ncbi:hypothetical protein HKX48_007454 [Thoreauomyces humboldtii]|nr:hypothetical protein HKX48_007454 [Thoreauomyces humboldtii]
MEQDKDFFDDNENIIQFMDITGGDAKAAKSYLQVTEGRLEQAITLFMENDGAMLHAELPPNLIPKTETGSSAGGAAASPPRDDDFVRAPIAAKREALFAPEPGNYYHDPSPLPPRPRPAPVAHVTPLSSDPSSRLAELFKPPYDIIHQAHTMQVARDYAKTIKKWIIITLNESSEFPCQVLNRDLWKDSAVQALVKEHFIFLYWNATSPASQEHKIMYPFDNYPYFAIIDPITGERMKAWNHVVTPAEFLSDVLDFLSRFSLEQTSTPAAKKKKTATKGKKAITELSEEEQLELALAASMGESSVVKEEHSEVVVLDDDAESADAVHEEKLAEPAPNRIQGKMNEEPTGPDATRVQFRLPDGTRKVRKFRKSDTIRTLFEYIRADVPEAAEKDFELMNFREPLLGRLDERIDDAKLAGASISVDFP